MKNLQDARGKLIRNVKKQDNSDDYRRKNNRNNHPKGNYLRALDDYRQNKIGNSHPKRRDQSVTN
jgi:hypothetical protein